MASRDPAAPSAPHLRPRRPLSHEDVSRNLAGVSLPYRESTPFGAALWLLGARTLARTARRLTRWARRIDAGSMAMAERARRVSIAQRTRESIRQGSPSPDQDPSGTPRWPEHRQGREEMRSLWLNTAVAKKIADDPEGTLTIARTNIAAWRRIHAHDRGATHWLNAWTSIIDQGAPSVIAALTATDERGADLRQNSPFPGVLSPAERDAALAEFYAQWPTGTRRGE